MYIYLNGEIVKQEDAKISVFEHGFMYGLGLFETFRVYKGHPFLLDDHFQRLRAGLKELEIDWPMNRPEILMIINDLLEVNKLTEKDAYVRFNVSAGVGHLGLQQEPYQQPTTIVYMKELPLQNEVVEKQGMILKTKRNSPEGNVRLKSHHFLNNIYGRREVGTDLNCEGIFLNDKGFLSEGVVSNIFWVKDGIVYTPSVETGILDGITRRFVFALLTHNEILYQTGYYTKEDLYNAEEVFVTNSIQEIVPLCSVDGISFAGKTGQVTTQLINDYNAYKKNLWSRIDIEGKD
ncbi:aminodeoxychorismate lyase [Anaerobacillus sp. MEB173]|uniref:aminodeoxychorismate lyase n=1 Tax=Anaerobacillus sp. MEB173 TaxID=3383345 RepID=UPI003F8F4546